MRQLLDQALETMRRLSPKIKMRSRAMLDRARGAREPEKIITRTCLPW
jgi:hypothetical protein